MTERLYLDDAYQFEFEAEVIGIEKTEIGFEVVLDRTAFYPEAGGQLFDLGTLNEDRVTAVHETETGEIKHIMDSVRFKLHDTVTGRIDRDRRLENMRKHTGQHILSQALVLTAEADTASAHLGEEESTIELNRDDLSERQLDEAERYANQIVLENRSVTTRMVPLEELKNISLRKIPDREGPFRIVEIEAFDVNACGGTHVLRTGEVGAIKITAREKLRGHLRITFLTGLQAYGDYAAKHRTVSDISQRLTCHFTDLPGAVKKLSDQATEYRREIGALHKKLMPYEIEGLVSSAETVKGIKMVDHYFERREIKDVKELAQQIINNHEAVVIFGTKETMLVACAEAVAFGAGEIVREIIGKFGGKGGGGKAFAQVGALPDEARDKILAGTVRLVRERLTETA
jgi:alanyl-tRNA synthetase